MGTRRQKSWTTQLVSKTVWSRRLQSFRTRSSVVPCAGCAEASRRWSDVRKLESMRTIRAKTDVAWTSADSMARRPSQDAFRDASGAVIRLTVRWLRHCLSHLESLLTYRF